jgi:EmrB/QacA subfamily drug resistance transporter
MKAAHGTADVALSRADRTIAWTLVLGATLPLLDATLLNIAIHGIGRSLAVSLPLMQWVITAYALAAAATVPLSAWLCERLGAKTVWLACLWIFLAGACLCGLSWTVEMLIGSRVLQGMATGVMLPTMQTILVTAIGRKKTRSALTLMSIPSVVVPILGPLIGGAALQMLDWRAIFWLHVPISLLSIRFASQLIPDMAAAQRTALDATGLLLLSSSLAGCIYGLSAARSTGLPLISGAAGLVALLAFLMHASRQRENAIVDLRLFAIRPFRRSSGLLLLSSVAYYGGLLLFSLYFIEDGRLGLTIAGALLALQGVGMLLARQLLPMVARHCSEFRVAQSCILMAVSGSILLLPPFAYDLVLMAVGMLLRGAGIGVLTLLSMSSAYTGLSSAQIPHASSLTRIMTLAGSAIGTALVAVLSATPGVESEGATPGGFSAHLVLILTLLLCGAVCPKPARPTS